MKVNWFEVRRRIRDSLNWTEALGSWWRLWPVTSVLWFIGACLIAASELRLKPNDLPS
jgi:hypothetical protein